MCAGLIADFLIFFFEESGWCRCGAMCVNTASLGFAEVSIKPKPVPIVLPANGLTL
jgi:hypothetical protein